MIGYLTYVEFVSGDNDAFLLKLDSIFDEFATAGITDLVVDLRYNPGGEISAALQLASAIVPSSVAANNSILINMKYNADFQGFLEYYSYWEYLYLRFVNNVTNLNMQRVYFLTTGSTASASELVITGLDPYMDVVQIGEPTFGKYTGAWIIPDDDEKWAMVPIVNKYANSSGYTDFVDGLAPDYVVSDDLFSAVPFGDTSDPMLDKAIELITGKKSGLEVAKQAAPAGLKQIFPEQIKRKMNIWFSSSDDSKFSSSDDSKSSDE
jgi:C-terminal processing protease CtpA/Prc